jgi:hypothetical protein
MLNVRVSAYVDSRSLERTTLGLVDNDYYLANTTPLEPRIMPLDVLA